MEAATGLLAGSGWAAGINLYAVVVLLNVYGRLGLGDVPDALLRTDVLVAAAALYAVEFVTDKVPYLDSLWDAAHTVVRPVGAGLLGVVLAGEVPGLERTATAAGSGGLAFAAHAAKATARAAINTSPEPASNILVSLLEDGLVAAVVWLALRDPVAATVVVVLLVIAGSLLIVLLWSAARTTLHRPPLPGRPRGGGRTLGA